MALFNRYIFYIKNIEKSLPAAFEIFQNLHKYLKYITALLLSITTKEHAIEPLLLTSELQRERSRLWKRQIVVGLLSHKLLTRSLNRETTSSLEKWKDDVAGFVRVCVLHVCEGVAVSCRRSGATIWVWPPLFCQHIECPQNPSLYPLLSFSLLLSAFLCLSLPPLSPPLSASLPQSQGVTKTLLVSYLDL